MKTRILFTMVAIFAIIMAVGCSNDQRVANVGTLGNQENPDLKVMAPGSELEIAGNHNDPGTIVLRGRYYEYDGVCPFLFIDKSQIVEVTFITVVPDFVVPGAYLEVSGHYGINQYSKCELGPMFLAQGVRSYDPGDADPPNDHLGPKEDSDNPIGSGLLEGPGPSLVLGTFHRVGASCMYIEIDKAKQVELQLQTNSPLVPPDGAIVQASGYYSMTPATPCNLGPLFIATGISVLTENFDAPEDGGTIAGGFGPEPQVLLGIFRRLGANCRYLEIDKMKSVELRFQVYSPQDPVDGDILEVTGFYSSLPGNECDLGQVFVVNSYSILSDQYNPPADNNQPLGDENPQPQTILGRYYRMGTSCEYLQSEKEKNIELQFQADSPAELKEGSLLIVTGQYSMLPSSQCGFDQVFIVESFSQVTDQADQSEDIPMPAGSNPNNDNPVSVYGTARYFGKDCLFIEVSKTQLVELRFVTAPPSAEISPGSVVQALGHFLSNPISNCNLGPVLGVTSYTVYNTGGISNPGFIPKEGDDPISQASPIVLVYGTLGHWGGDDGCPYIEVAKDSFVELSFLQDAPIPFKDGSFLEVSGYYTTYQASDCQIGPILVVASMNHAPVDKMKDSGMQDQNN